jgi:hypothetical protein
MIGIAILVIFLLFAGLMYARIVPALLAVPCMAVIMAFAARVPAHTIGNLVVAGAVSLAPVYVAVIFGALLGRVTLDTGIARAIVNLAAEYGGENPLVLALTLSAITALLFVSLNGLGAIIMVGSIVLPIMMTSGIPRKIAAPLFLMAFALGFIFNIANWKFYTSFFGVTQTQLLEFAIVLAVIDAAALVFYTVISLRRERDYAAWAVRSADGKANEGGEAQSQQVPWYALVAPVLPILLYFTLHIDPILAFALSAIYAAIAAKPQEIVKTLMAAAIRGVEDVAPAIVLFIGIGVLLTMTKAPQFAQALQPLVSGGWTHNPIAFVAIFGLLSPLALYRGPLNPFGVGIAIFTVLLASHALPAVVVVAAVMAVVQVQNVCDPTNTANVWVANFTGTPIQEITKRTLPYQVVVATLACILIVLGSQQLFGVRAFALAIPRAMADSWPGLLSLPSAANTVAVGDDGSTYAQAGADIIARTIPAGGVLHVLRFTEDPNATDCARKKYAAYIAVTSTAFRLREGTDLDIGLRLEDCGGWEVTEWHDHTLIVPNTSASDWLIAEHGLALEGLARMQNWALANPEKSTHLWTNGLAYAKGDRLTYYYSLFKTVDGYMRAFVRAGGPAYDAGLRTNDIVDKIDGQFWWEYGTFQSQARAYDGKPHSFEVERGSQTLDLQLDEPFAPPLS